MKTKTLFPKNRRRAFSLVEVTLALGLTSFALVAVLGLMPVGFTSMREAVDSTVESQITREIRAKAQQTSFADLVREFSGREFFFAESGVETSSDAFDRRYTVKTLVEVPVYPGSENAGADSLSTLAIEISTGDGENRRTSVRHLLVANHGGY
jgi:Verrucomicrobium spinosum paralogous family TIGR02598